MRNIKGFTLIELLVVVAIIGILSTMAAASFNSAQMKARDSQRRSDLSQIRSALELAKSDTLDGTYPNKTFSTLKTFLEGSGGANSVYMKTVPNDPKSGSWTYYYEPVTPPTITDYRLIACLENLSDPKGDIAVLGQEATQCSATGQVNSVTFTAP